MFRLSPGVGGARGDEARRVTGKGGQWYFSSSYHNEGALYDTSEGAGTGESSGGFGTRFARIDTALVTPVGPVNAPRRWGSLACAFLGTPMWS